MPVTQNIRLLIEWSPVLNLLSAIASSSTAQERAVAVARLGEFLASKTETKIDDRLVRVITDILLTPQGAALLEYLTALVDTVAEKADGPSGLAGN